MILYSAADMLLVLLLCLGFEFLWGDPKSSCHPVALFGRWLHFLESFLWKNSRLWGVLTFIVAVFVPTSVLFVLFWLVGQWDDVLYLLLQALLLWSSVGWKSLIEHALATSDTDDLQHAQAQVSKMVGRKTSTMDAQDIRRASVESLAENSSDSIIAPLFYFALFGALGAWFYRMVNTMDAMWGYKNQRFLAFGWCAARVDDGLNLVPSRLTALLMLIQKPQVIKQQIYHQAKQHLSPNAGYPETSLAYMLGVRLGGPVQRDWGEEPRAWMGEVDTAITAQHLQRGVQYVNRTVYLMLVLLFAVLLGLAW